jgi:hypothetical protein
VDIGEPQRIIQIEPVAVPLPEVMPDPTIEPEPEPVSAPPQPVS